MSNDKTTTNALGYDKTALEGAPVELLAKMCLSHGIKVRGTKKAAYITALTAVTASTPQDASSVLGSLGVTTQEAHAAHCAANQLIVRMGALRTTETLRRAISSPKFNTKPVGKGKRIRNWDDAQIERVVAFVATKYGYLPV